MIYVVTYYTLLYIGKVVCLNVNYILKNKIHV